MAKRPKARDLDEQPYAVADSDDNDDPDAGSYPPCGLTGSRDGCPATGAENCPAC